MTSICDEIDEYFNPQSKILRKFSIPREFFNYDVKDLRNYIWYEDKQSKLIRFGVNLSKDRTVIMTNFNRDISDVKTIPRFRIDGLRIFLIRSLFNKSGREFVILEDAKELKFINGKFYYNGE